MMSIEGVLFGFSNYHHRGVLPGSWEATNRVDELDNFISSLMAVGGNLLIIVYGIPSFPGTEDALSLSMILLIFFLVMGLSGMGSWEYMWTDVIQLMKIYILPLEAVVVHISGVVNDVYLFSLWVVIFSPMVAINWF